MHGNATACYGGLNNEVSNATILKYNTIGNIINVLYQELGYKCSWSKIAQEVRYTLPIIFVIVTIFHEKR